MRFNFIVFADTAKEFEEVLATLRVSVPPGVWLDDRGFSIHVEPNGSRYPVLAIPLASLGPASVGDPSEALTEALTEAMDEAPAKAKRHRRTKAEMTAARAAAAAADSEFQPEDDPLPETDEDPIPEANKADIEIERQHALEIERQRALEIERQRALEIENGQTNSSLLAMADKIAALSVLQTAYGMAGGPDAIKLVLATFGVAKFAAVPDTEGTKLLQAANAMIGALSAYHAPVHTYPFA